MPTSHLRRSHFETRAPTTAARRPEEGLACLCLLAMSPRYSDAKELPMYVLTDADHISSSCEMAQEPAHRSVLCTCLSVASSYYPLP